jgi:hypothetical protein
MTILKSNLMIVLSIAIVEQEKADNITFGTGKRSAFQQGLRDVLEALKAGKTITIDYGNN